MEPRSFTTTQEDRSEDASGDHAEIERLQRELADRTRDVKRVHDAFEVASRQLDAVVNSRSYRLSAILRDAFHDWKMALAAPARLAWLALPGNAKTRIRARLQPLEAALRGKPLRKVRNELWPADQPLVSVVIPCFNYGRYVEEALQSVVEQTFRDFEILIVDGGSTLR